MISSMPAPTLICCAHGTRSPAGRQALGTLIGQVRSALPQVPVRTAFVDVQPPEIASVVKKLASRSERSVVVPLLLASGYHVDVDISQAVADQPAIATAALGPDHRLSSLLTTRLAEIGQNHNDVVVLAAAGSSKASSVPDTEQMAQQLATKCGSPVLIGYGASRTPKVPQAVNLARSQHPGRRVIIASYLLAPGFFASRLHQAGADLVTKPLISSDAANRELVDLICQRYHQASAHY